MAIIPSHHIVSDIQTITPKTKVSPTSLYRHQPRSGCTTDSESDANQQARALRNQNNHAAADDSDSERESPVMVDRTLRHSFEVAPSSSDLTDIERKLDMWSRQLNSNIMVSCVLVGLVERSRQSISVAF